MIAVINIAKGSIRKKQKKKKKDQKAEFNW